MSYSVQEMLEDRDAKSAAIRKALEMYPDLVAEGDYLYSAAMPYEDCDTIVCVPRKGKDGLDIVPARLVDNVAVLRWRCVQRGVEGWLYDMQKRAPKLYRAMLDDLTRWL